MAARMPFTGSSPSRLVKAQKANTISTKYSAGPNATAQPASMGASSTMPQMAIVEPIKEEKADKDKATLARPLRASG